jgi:hypothetical protein
MQLEMIWLPGVYSSACPMTTPVEAIDEDVHVMLKTANWDDEEAERQKELQLRFQLVPHKIFYGIQRYR